MRFEEDKNMNRSKSKDVALIGMLFALALVLSVLESSITPLLGLAPGVKIGLANIVVMYALLCLDVRRAALLVALKAGFAFLTRGAVAALLSGCGGGLSLLVMAAMLRWGKPTNYILSASGAICHNIGQLIGASLTLGSKLALGYAPVLLISGLGMGMLTSMTLTAVMPALQRLGHPAKGLAGQEKKDAQGKKEK